MGVNNNNLVWKVMMAFSVLFFGVFIYYYILKNRKYSYSTELNNESYEERMAGYWKNVFQHLGNAFNKTKQ